MKPVSKQDYYQCKRCYGASSMDLESLTDFYLPLVGTDAFGVYLSLIREGEGTFVHDDLLRFLGVTPGEFEIALNALEAVGLVRTFTKAEGDLSLFVYCLYAPLHASEFNADIMLSGTLKGKLGEEAYRRLIKRHTALKAIEDMEEVSSSFPNVFRERYDAKFYLSHEDLENNSGKARANTGFDTVEFVRATETAGLRKNAISDGELVEIQKIAALYGIDEKAMAEYVLDAVQINQPIGKKINLDRLTVLCSRASTVPVFTQLESQKSEVSGEGAMAKLIKIMDQKTPVEFLRILQKGNNPAEADLRLLSRLSRVIGLSNPCINALVFYVVTENDNTLPGAYCEKIAAALIRQGCQTARDVLDYLWQNKRRKKSGKRGAIDAFYNSEKHDQNAERSDNSNPDDDIESDNNIEQKKEPEISDEELDRLLDDAFGE